jgi:hypothetical protein
MDLISKALIFGVFDRTLSLSHVVERRSHHFDLVAFFHKSVEQIRKPRLALLKGKVMVVPNEEKLSWSVIL